MLLDADLDNRFWGEAVLTATYLQNRVISRSIDKTPVELFTGERPDIGHIRVFGSKIYSLVPKQRRRKWDDKAEEGVLVGYDGNTKGYRILNPNTNRVWISRSVKVLECNTHELDLQQNTVDYETTVEEGTVHEIDSEKNQ